jgi:exosortase/archaeosortase family protein
MALPAPLNDPRFVRWGIRIDTAPEALWIGLFALALWPAWVWMGRRMLDGSDDPLGLLALGLLAALAWQQRRLLRPAPALGWLTSALGLALAATVGQLAGLPPLVACLLAVLALAAALAAWLPRALPRLPLLGLAVLALPLLASLQFYAGYPLRVLTAEASRWLLSVGFTVQRAGASLWVDGRLVLVDAPCSGVQMAWLAYFSAFATALWWRQRDGVLLARLPVVGLIVLVANVLRNSMLVAFAGAGQPLSGWAHEAVGLLVLAGVCALVHAWVRRGAPA